MNKTTRLIIVIGCIVTFIVIPLGTWLWLSNNAKPPTVTQDQSHDTNLPERSNNDLEGAITSARSDLVSDNQPTFVITGTKKMKDGWYVVTIRLKDDVEGANPAKVLLHDTSSGLSVILGPGTSFEPDVTDGLGIPSEVVQELNT